MNIKFLHLYLLVFFVSLLPKIVVIFFFPAGITGDQVEYINVAKNIISGCGISNSPIGEKCILDHGGTRGPGYPIILSLLLLLFNNSYFLIRIFQAVVLSLSIIYILESISKINLSKITLLMIGFVLALSPVTVAWSRFLLTEAFTISITLFLFAEIFKIIIIKKINFLRISLIMIIGSFLRIDLIFLFLPLFISIISVYSLKKSFREILKITIIFLIPWTLWMIRNYKHDLQILPQHPGVVFIKLHNLNNNNNSNNDGYFQWTNTWIVNEYQRAGAWFPVFLKKYSDIFIDFDSLNIDSDEKIIAQDLLIKLYKYDDKEFPNDIDRKFNELAKNTISNGKLNYYFLLPMKRFFFIWCNLTSSNAWPVEYTDLSYEKRVNLLKGSFFQKLKFISDNIGYSLTRVFGNLWRITILFLFIYSIKYCLINKEMRVIIIPILLFFFIKNIFSIYFNFIELRYMVNLIPLLELISILYLSKIFEKKKLINV